MMFNRTKWINISASPFAISMATLGITLMLGGTQSALCQESLDGGIGTKVSPTVQSDLASRQVSVLPAQTLVKNFSRGDANGETVWNRLVLLATPKINSGDTEAVSSMVRDAATACSLTIMASVSNDRTKVHSMNDIGVGYSIATGGERTIVSSAGEDDASQSLGFIPRQVLRANEQQLAKVRLVAMSATLAVLDAPTVFHRKGKPKKFLTRHFLWINPETGEGQMMVWLLTPTALKPSAPDAKSLQHGVISFPIRHVNWAEKETRRIHVDGSEFSFLGIPRELAFALEDLPPGTDHAWTRQAANLAGCQRYSPDTLQSLHRAILSILKSSVARETLDSAEER